MGGRAAMPEIQRNVAFGMLCGGMSARSVARHVGVNSSTIFRLRESFHATGSVLDRPWAGEPRKIFGSECGA